MFDGELQNLGLLQLSAVRIPRRCRDQSSEFTEGRVDPVAPLLLDHPPPAFPRRVLARISPGRVASAKRISRKNWETQQHIKTFRGSFLCSKFFDWEGERTCFNYTLLTYLAERATTRLLISVVLKQCRLDYDFTVEQRDAICRVGKRPTISEERLFQQVR